MCSLDDTCISQLHEYIVFKKLSGKIYIRENWKWNATNVLLQSITTLLKGFSSKIYLGGMECQFIMIFFICWLIKDHNELISFGGDGFGNYFIGGGS